MSIKRIEGVVESKEWKLRYIAEGQGPDVFVIGSASYYDRSFSRNIRNSCRMIFADHRGYAEGPRSTDKKNFSLEVILEDIELVRKELGLKRFVLVGHSGHGYMALEYAKKYPQNVSHLILMCMTPDLSGKSHELIESYFQENASPERREYFAERMSKLGEAISRDPENVFKLFNVYAGARSWYDFTYDSSWLWEGIPVNTAFFDHVWGEIFRDIDVKPAVRSLDVPVFLVLGRYDYLMPPASTWESVLPLFKDVTVRFFEKSGHTPQLEEQERFDEEVLFWLRQKTPDDFR
ncbi:alpha/beta hydrolase [Leptospira gomenensis]|uniref:Alpha/beta hydrolase n=1 Tax=Leptospira gomenensis TaxID=2484974 RepID=A0A5F1YE43_9LEPT|nr:alpha/beta hydrolase [Leptospira gomenensis]TGK36460.1 alpha/beta hydrolase [Leptospira gomenensis]TGK38289.1 alpha/beta hydrolase [Leptospira gomenensis]TGK46030.1 alpha/beta hydrolase [Leptospira gomenensis]TGK65294.1 alpha/beta hydrolase [Leptospira gomenensis]